METALTHTHVMATCHSDPGHGVVSAAAIPSTPTVAAVSVGSGTLKS